MSKEEILILIGKLEGAKLLIQNVGEILQLDNNDLLLDIVSINSRISDLEDKLEHIGGISC